MLAAVVLIALVCGWFVHARDRANDEEALIAMLRDERGTVWVERWGPLSQLSELSFLRLSSVHENQSSIGNFQTKPEGGLLLNLPPLARLDAIDLEESEVYDGDIAALTKLPRLKWLNLAHTPERGAAWWPASEWPVLSPSQRADFQKRGGWARFDAAGWGTSGPTTTF